MQEAWVLKSLLFFLIRNHMVSLLTHSGVFAPQSLGFILTSLLEHFLPPQTLYFIVRQLCVLQSLFHIEPTLAYLGSLQSIIPTSAPEPY